MIVWLASYPRSGNTLLRTVIKRCFDLDSYADEAIHVESPIRSDSSLVGHRELPEQWDRFYEAATKDKRVFLVKTHLPPRDAQPYIYVARDGRSAIKSYQKYYEKYVPGHNPSLYQIIAGDDVYGDWSSHYRAWVARQGPRGMTVRFEDLTHITPEQLKRLGAFIGHPGPVVAWDNPFSALAEVEPGFFREGSKEFTRGDDWPELANQFFEFCHSELLAELGYPPAGTVPSATESSVLFQWTRELVARNRGLRHACDERLDLINRLSEEAQRRLDIINAMAGKSGKR